jgi:RHS repeat-associated protein
VRKVVLEGQFREERIYLGAYELYRRYSINGADPDRELQTLHLMDDSQRVCMIETGAIGPSFTVSRFQLSNHLGSVAIETDESAEVISYEEYHPYGSTAYRSRTAQIEVGAKRYRYTGMERDEETGLTYFSHRYYADFHIKWISVDPKKEKYFGLSPYHFTGNNPVAQREVDGQDFETVVDKENKTITIRANFYTYEQDKEVAEEGAKFWNDQSGKYYLKTDKGEGEYELYRVNFELNVKVVEDTGDEETDFADAAKDPIGNIITRRFEDATNDNGKNVFSKDPNSVQLAINERNSYKASDEPLADQIRINDSVAGVYGNVGATLAHEMGHSLDLTTLNYGHTSGIMHKNKDGNTNPDTNNQLHASTVRNILYSADILPGSGALAGPKMKVMGGGDDLSFENGYVLSHDQVRRLKVSEARKSFRVAIKKIIRRRIALFFQGKKTRGERMKLKEQTKELRQERKKRIQEIRKQF